jgi:hypothetical protein
MSISEVLNWYREIPDRREVERVAEAPKKRGNLENLKHDFTTEELASNGAKGGVKSGETRRRQRTFRDSVNAILACKVQDEEQRKALEALGIDPTMLNQIQLAVYGKAAKGDVEAARFLRDTRGEKPREALEVGNLDGKPLASIDLTGMTDEQLKALAAQRAEEE